MIFRCYSSEKLIALNTFTSLSPPGTHFTAESTEAMRIKRLAQGRNILLPGFEPSTSVCRNRHSNQTTNMLSQWCSTDAPLSSRQPNVDLTSNCRSTATQPIIACETLSPKFCILAIITVFYILIAYIAIVYCMMLVKRYHPSFTFFLIITVFYIPIA